MTAVRRIAPLPLLSAPIGAPEFVEGFFDYQGDLMAVVRLDRLLGQPDDDFGLYSPLILLADDEPPIALHATRIDGMSRVDAGAIQPISDGETFNGCVTGRFSDGGETIYLLDAQNLLLAAERSRIAAHEAMRRHRLDALQADHGHAA